MSEEQIKPNTTVGKGGRSLRNWSVLAQLRKDIAADPASMDRLREDPVKTLVEAGFDMDEPFAGPGLQGLSLRELVDKTPGIDKVLPAIVSSALDAMEATPLLERALPRPTHVPSPEDDVLPALVLANANAVANANANANANGDGAEPVQSSTMWDRNRHLSLLQSGSPATWPGGLKDTLFATAALNFRLLKMSEAKITELIERIANDPTRKLYEKQVNDGLREGFEHRHGDNIVEVRVLVSQEGTRVIESASVRPA